MNKLYLTLLLLLFSCTQRKSYNSTERLYEQEMYSLGYAEEEEIQQQSSVKKNTALVQKRSLQDSNQVAQMVHYNGYAELQVSRPEEVLDDIAELSKQYNGNIERRSTVSITIRVPKESFESVFSAVLELGEVISKSITSEDITEAYTSIELRLQTAKTTRDRLITLLEKTNDEQEKINILRQIQRLNEQIDLIESQMRTLQNLAELSTISVEVRARRAQSNLINNEGSIEPAGFEWIHELSPFQNMVCTSGKRLELPTPSGLVSLRHRGPYSAESADGTVLRSTTLSNRPKGDADFWRRAIQKRLEGGFGNVEKGTLGQFATLTFWEDSDSPYIWSIAIQTDGSDLNLIEVYYPSLEQRERYQADIEASILGGTQ